MENSYGIGITNRYDLFCMDDDANDMELILSKKAKQQKKAAAAAAKAAAGGNEKENKVAPATIKPLQSAGNVKGTQQQNGQPPKSTRPIKETQNIRSNSDKGPREASTLVLIDTEKSKDGKAFDRNSTPNNKQNGDTREQRYNRRNRDDTIKSTQQYNGTTTTNQSGNNNVSEQNSNHRNDDRPPRRNNNFAGGNERRGGGGDGQRRTYEGRGKREFDRQSGSEKTGVKAIDKREGGGAHNWGTHKQDIEDLNKTNAEWDPEKDNKEEGGAEGNGNKEETDAQQSPAEEETKEITLDEWKAQKAVRAKPQFNIRKAGEGEDTSQWKKMVALESRKKKGEENSDEEMEYDPSMYPQRVGRQKHVLDIEFHFNDGRRGGLNRGRGNRPRVGGGSNNAGERGERRGPNRNRADRQDNDGNERSENDRPTRPPRERRVPYGDDRRGGHGQNAPKVDDEHDFPSLN
ncbi:Plasminogen activator inhibitor 1 RNA-binding protein [Pseudolycoriella hygida]|uniref:Plasminogen activator inhibitor 1 RNA-binding protein n=1 Tax=Pseudolycoriella hygida TaxID=35572 RepID=A0A9Q0N0H9_9DIPT|nr:Plasminogen activator inhibitor 1 RNA-binding protein [Pseudolycoriella hygida]